MSTSEWREVKLGQISNTLLGKTLPKGEGKNPNGSFYLRNNNVRWGKIDFNDLNKMTFSDKEKEKYTLKKGDILVCEGGEVGRCAVLEKDYSNIFFQNAIHRVRVDKSAALPLFVSMSIEKIVMDGMISKFSRRVSIAHLNQSMLRSIPILLPPLPVQQRIVTVMQSIDDHIANMDTYVSSLEALRMNTLNSLLSGEESEDWEEVKLGEVAEGYQPKTISKKELVQNGKYPVYGANGIMGYYNQYNHEESQIAIGCRGSIGSFNFTKPFSWINGNAMVVKSITKKLSNSFLALFLQNYNFSKITSGSVQPQLTRGSIYKIDIIIPPLSEQERIVNIMSNIDDSLNSAREEVKALREMRTNVLNALLSGEHEIPESLDNMITMTAQ